MSALIVEIYQGKHVLQQAVSSWRLLALSPFPPLTTCASVCLGRRRFLSIHFRDEVSNYSNRDPEVSLFCPQKKSFFSLQTGGMVSMCRVPKAESVSLSIAKRCQSRSKMLVSPSPSRTSVGGNVVRLTTVDRAVCRSPLSITKST